MAAPSSGAAAAAAARGHRSRGLCGALAVPLLALPLVCLTAHHYGVSWDEKVQRDYGVLGWEYFRSLGADARCNTYLNLRWYTPAYEALLHLAARRAAPWQLGPPAHPTPLAAEYAVRHLLNGVVGVAALLAAAVFARLAQRGRRAAPPPCVGALLLAATPRFYGHFFANTKDIPFAAAFAWSMVGIVCTLMAIAPAAETGGPAGAGGGAVPRLRLPWASGTATAFAVGLTISLRSAGLLLLPMAAAGLLATITNAYTEPARPQLPPLPQTLAWLVLAVSSLWCGIVALWPAAHAAPLSHPIQTVLESVHFSTVVRMRFGGADVWSNALPRHYYLEMFAVTLPLPTLLCMCGGVAHALGNLVSRRAPAAAAKTATSKAATPSTESSGASRVTVDVPRLLLLLWALVPLLMFFASPLNVYDGVRHFLFVLPPLALLGAEPLGIVLQCEALPILLRWAVVLCASLSAVPTMVALHPYQNSYFSDIVGGLGAVAQEPPAYDTEYWATCYREAAAWSVQHAADGKPRHVLGAANAFSKECIEPFVPPQWNVSTTLDAAAPRLPAGVDYYVATTRWDMHQLYPESTVVHRVERMGATLCVVKSDRPEAQPSAHSSPRTAYPGGLPHQLLREETIRDGNDPPPPPAPLPTASRQPDPTTNTAADSVTTATDSSAAAAAIAEEAARRSLQKQAASGATAAVPQQKPGDGSGMQPVALPPGSVEDEDSAMFAYALGNTLRDKGRVEEALSHYTESINRDNGSPAAYNNLGALLEAGGRMREAVHIYGLAVQRHPDFALGFFNLGSRLMLSLPEGADTESQLAQAIGHLQRSVELNPKYFSAWSNLGDAHRAVGNLDDALRCYHESLSLSPTYEVARNNLGNALKTAGRLNEAAVQYDLAVRSSVGSQGEHGSAAMWANLGAVYMEQDKLQDALWAYGNATLANPAYAAAYSNMGRIYEDQGLIETALVHFRRAYELEPSHSLEMSMALLLPPIMPAAAAERELTLAHIVKYLDTVLSDDAGSLGREDFRLDNPVDDLGSMAFYLTYYGVNLRPVREKLAAVALKGFPSLKFEAAHCQATARPADRRIQIGIASKSFYDHSTGKWMVGLIRDLDRRRFEVTVVSIPPLRNDSLSNDIRAAADRFVTPTDQLPDIREAIAALQLDVLVLCDVGMDTTLYALAFARLAPVQVGMAAAWPVTTGIPTVDYMATFDVEIGTADTHYSESLLRLPGLLPYAAPVEPSRAEELAALHADSAQLAAARSDLGLPLGKLVYLCIQAPYKFHPDFDRAIGSILRSGPADSVVALVWGKAEHWTNALLRRFQETLGDDAAALAQRIILLPRLASSRMPSLLASADVVLDTWPFGGGVTSFEALSVGRPVVTLAYDTMPGRFTYAFYVKMGVWECVAFDAEEYVQTAVRLGLNATLRAEVGDKIFGAVGRIFDDTAAIRAFETAIAEVV